MLFSGQVAPTGHWSQFEALDENESLALEGPSIDPGSIQARTVVPVPRDGLPGSETPKAARSRPFVGRADEVLLAPVAKQVEEPLDLGCGLLRNEDRLVAASPELLSPAYGATHFAGEVGVEVVHEGGEASGARSGEEQVVVVSEEHEGVHLYGIEAYGASEDAAAQVGDERCRLEQEPPLHGSASDLDERARRMKADATPHEVKGRNPPPAILRQVAGTSGWDRPGRPWRSLSPPAS
jgi:hypothetical protein